MEQFANTPITTLNMGGTLSSSATTITVTSATLFPTSGTFRILIDTEILKVTAVSGNNFTVVRGDGGTTAATHADGTQVWGIVTKEALDSIVSILQNGTEISTRRTLNFVSGASISDNPTNNRCDITISGGGGGGGIGYGTYASRPTTPTADNVYIASDSVEIDVGDGTNLNPFMPIFPVTKPPLSSTFSWVNQNGATVTDLNFGMNLVYPAGGGGDNWSMLVKTMPTAPFTITVAFMGLLCATAHSRVAIILRNSTSGAFMVHSFNAEPTPTFDVTSYNNPTTGVANLISHNCALICPILWMRYKDDGTNRFYYVSADGQVWVQIYTEGNTNFVTPNQLGWGMNQNTGHPSTVNLIHWKQT